MKTILISAYSVNPYEGSEAGTGWNIIHQLAKANQLIVITRHNNLPAIEKYLNEHPESHMQTVQFRGFDLPEKIMKWKKKLGERGYVLYFYFWQLFLPFFIKKQALSFDIAHSLNFHSDSHATFLWLLKKPTFWGPVGHHPKVPKQYILKEFGYSHYLKDRLYYAVKWLMRNLDPLYFIAKYRVHKIFTINSSIAKTIGVDPKKVTILPAVASARPIPREGKKEDNFTVLSVGRFHYMKGFDITLNAFARFHETLSPNEKEKCKLRLVGSGPEEKQLKQLALKLEIDKYVQWVKWVDQEKMHQQYHDADVFLFPSHEGAGMVIPEAMSYGLPTLTFDNVGPGELAGDESIRIAYRDYSMSVIEFSNELIKLYRSSVYYKQHQEYALARYQQEFTWARKAELIQAEYDKVDVQKRIAVFHPSSELYGADRILVNALKALPTDIEKRVYLKFKGPLEDFLAQEVENVKVQVVPSMPIIYRAIFNLKGLAQFGLEFAKFARFIYQENKKHRFTSAYLNTLSTSFIAPIIWMLGVRQFIHVHEIIESPRLIGKLTAYLGYLFCNRVVCVSKAVQEQMQHYLGAISLKSEVLHNGIDAIPAAPKTSSEKLSFYLFGRIMKKKGQWFLLESLKQLSQKAKSSIQVTLMGGPVPGQENQLDQIKTMIKDYGLQEVVKLKGFSKSIHQAMAQADVCLVPSMMKDPFPTTVLEAMSAGKPVIATNHGGASEAVNGSDCGFLIDPGSTTQLAQSIENFVENKQLLSEMGRAAKFRFESHFTKAHFDRNWLNFNRQFQFI